MRHFDPDALDDFAALCADPVVMQYRGDGQILDRSTAATIDVRNPISVGVARKMGMKLVRYVDEGDDVRIGYCVRGRHPAPLSSG